MCSLHSICGGVELAFMRCMLDGGDPLGAGAMIRRAKSQTPQNFNVALFEGFLFAAMVAV
jgi:hypothetical protein